jgi:hypothetical protein
MPANIALFLDAKISESAKFFETNEPFQVY